MYVLQQLNIHSNIRDQMTDGYMYVGQPTYNYTWFSRYVLDILCRQQIKLFKMLQLQNSMNIDGTTLKLFFWFFLIIKIRLIIVLKKIWKLKFFGVMKF
jgi:hypothetical protein